MANRERGSAVVEASAVTLLLALSVGGFLLGAYLLFTAIWLEHQSEQALFCAARLSAQECSHWLRKGLEEFLPWGRITRLSLHSYPEFWELNLEWRWKNYVLQKHKTLAIRHIIKSGDLHW